MGKNIYTKPDKNVPKPDRCCTANSGCVTPEVYSPEDIMAECIFVEKVYDSILFREEANQTETVLFDLNDSIPVGSEIIRATVTCSVKPNNGSTGVVIDSTINSINGITPPSGPTPIGPGGMELIPLDFIDTAECDAEGRGTPIIVDQTIEVSGQVRVTISGIARVEGRPREFSVSQVIDVDEFTINRFARLCIPSTYAAQKPSLAEFCAVLCDTILPLGLDSLEIIEGTTGTQLRANLILLFCIVCEKKVVVPVQLCVLSTGFCQPVEQQATLCQEFPRLFPEQVNVEIIGDDDN